jgi:hypothetical protein
MHPGPGEESLMRGAHTITVLVLAATAASACGHEYSETSTTTTTAARSRPANGDAIDAIANARCERESRCDNVGPGKRYVSREGCLTQLRGEGMNDLTPVECPHGVDSPQLDKCLADVRGERCENVLDTIARLSNCSTGSLCH